MSRVRVPSLTPSRSDVDEPLTRTSRSGARRVGGRGGGRPEVTATVHLIGRSHVRECLMSRAQVVGLDACSTSAVDRSKVAAAEPLLLGHEESVQIAGVFDLL